MLPVGHAGCHSSATVALAGPSRGRSPAAGAIGGVAPRASAFPASTGAGSAALHGGGCRSRPTPSALRPAGCGAPLPGGHGGGARRAVARPAAGEELRWVSGRGRRPRGRFPAAP